MKRLLLILILVACLVLVTSSGFSMFSSNYRLDWYPPLTGSGGVTQSAHYIISFTVGQTASGAVAGGGNQIGLGFWPGVPVEFLIRLPVVKR